MKKKILFTLLLVSTFICIFSIAISAANPVFEYDTTRTATLDNGETVPLYDEDGNALSYYNNGTEIVSDLTTNIFKWNGSGWLEMKDASVIPVANVVIMNLQDPTMDATASSNQGINLSFQNSTNLEYVYFSNMIKKFNGTYYFSNCDKMKVFEITADSMLESFGQYTFYDCAVLGALHIPAGVTAIPGSNSGNIGFASQCPLLSSVTFAEDIELKTIGETAFFSATSLKSIDLPNTLTEIKSSAFNNCTSLTGVKIPDSVTALGNEAFRSTAIVDSPFTANSQCITWGKFVFRNCDKLENFIVPRSLKTAAQDTSYGPFSECDGIKEITFGTYVDPVEGAMTTLPACFFSKGNVEKITLPEGITHIGAQAFNENKTLKEIVFPNSVVTAEQRVFQNCTALETIVFGNGFKHFTNTSTDHGSFTYGASNIKNIYLPASFYAENPGTAYRVSYMFQGGGSVKFFYTGTKEQMEAALEIFKTSTTYATDNNGNLLNATLVSKADYDANPSNYESGDYIIYGCDVCETFYNSIHDIEIKEGNTCSGICANCGLTQIVAKPVHKNEWILNDGNTVSYVSTFTAVCKCQYCGTVDSEETIAAIFTTKGYSKDENSNGVYQEFKVDKDALARYSEILEVETTTFGILAGIAGEEDGNPITVDENGKLSTVGNSVIGQFGLDSDYTFLKIKIAGINETASIYCGAFVALGQNVTYVCGTTEGSKASKYEFVIA